ncbi:MAG: dihydropteroate synthase [Ruminococcaceae bacterium]|nr:dihydropteroate synthase [Oscillospiraceae bacterium]
MIVIGEKINGAVPKTGVAIANRDAEYIKELVRMQETAGVSYLDVCASTDADIEYEALCWLIDTVQEVNTIPLCVDSPDPEIILKVFPRVKEPGLINSISLEGNKCELLFPLLRDNPEWKAVALCSGGDVGVSYTAEQKAELAFKIIERAAEYGVTEDRLFLDLLIFDASTRNDTAIEFCKAIRMIKERYPNTIITGALSNVSFTLPVKKALNMAFLTLAMDAGLDSFIGDTTNRDLKALMLATNILIGKDKHCRKYTNAYRKGEIGPIKKD